jgi:hypothetical protein
MSPESFPLPADYCIRFHEQQSFLPIRPILRQNTPQDPVSWTDLGSLDGALKNTQLMAKGDVLCLETCPCFE